MTSEFNILIWTAVTVAFVHTVLGPDHYLPFIAMSVSRKWSRIKTLYITIFCGLGHVMSSVLLAAAGLVLGKSVFSIKSLESFRGEIAAWLLIIFGFSYLVYGIFEAIKNRPHEHAHFHGDGNSHAHTHVHRDGHMHVHEKKPPVTAWAFFIIFFLGPCEPLIPLIMYPAAKGNVKEAVFTAIIFSAVTIITMTAGVMLTVSGLSMIHLKRLERFSHVIAGSMIFLCGIGIRFLGL